MMSFVNKYKSFTYLIFTIIIYSCTKTSPSAFQKDAFIKSYGGAFEDETIDVIKDNGNYYILGNLKDANDSTKIYLIKVDEFGNKVWSENKTFTKNRKNSLASQIIKLEKRQGFAIIGSIELDNDSLYYDPYLIIVDENGEIIEDSVYSSIDTSSIASNEIGKCIGELKNGELSISANIYLPDNTSLHQSITFQVDQNMQARYPKLRSFEVNSICKKTVDNGFYISGQGAQYSGILIIEENGVASGPIWFDKLSNANITNIIQSRDGNTFICGAENVGSFNGSTGFIAKLSSPDDNSNVDWKLPYNTSENGNDIFNHLVINENNELLLVGSSENPEHDNSFDIWVYKTDALGNKLNQSLLGGTYDEFGVKIMDEDNDRFTIASTIYFNKNAMISLIKTEFE